MLATFVFTSNIVASINPITEAFKGKLTCIWMRILHVVTHGRFIIILLFAQWASVCGTYVIKIILMLRFFSLVHTRQSHYDGYDPGGILKSNVNAFILMCNFRAYFAVCGGVIPG